jgi:hypothetical protein
MNESSKKDALLRAKLNQETARMPWTELQRHFAAGIVFMVSDDLDLVDVAATIANDNKTMVMEWLKDRRLERVPDALAKAWLENDAALWTVIVKPWILVQMKAS